MCISNATYEKQTRGQKYMAWRVFRLDNKLRLTGAFRKQFRWEGKTRTTIDRPSRLTGGNKGLHALSNLQEAKDIDGMVLARVEVSGIVSVFVRNTPGGYRPGDKCALCGQAIKREVEGYLSSRQTLRKLYVRRRKWAYYFGRDGVYQRMPLKTLVQKLQKQYRVPVGVIT